MRTRVLAFALVAASAVAAVCYSLAHTRDHILRLYIVHHGRNAFDELVLAFECKTGIRVHDTHACRTELFDLVSKAGDADVCVTSGQDNIERFEKAGLSRGRAVTVAELIPVIEVIKGNPRKIAAVAALARPGVRVALGADSGCLGLTASQIFSKARVAGLVEHNVVKRVKGEHNVAASVDGKEVDATIVWASTTLEVAPDRYDMVPVPVEQTNPDPVGAIILKGARSISAAEEFVSFLQSDEARKVLRAAGLLRPLPEAPDARTPASH